MTNEEPTLLFETVHGSAAYGLAREGSDLDLKGAIVGPPSWYFGITAAPEQIELSADHVRYEVRKLLRLAAVNNPSVLEILFAHEDDHRVVHPAFERVLEARPSMLSRRVAGTFGGYAMSQLARIRRHRRWLLEPPDAPPERASFGLPDRRTVPRDQLGAAETLIERGLEASDSFLALLGAEKRYRAAQKEWSQYQQWLKHRNPKRAALEAEHGYDTKHAMHLVRLSKMAVEILETGEVRVRRDDRDELLAVRDGVWSYDALLEKADALKAQIERAEASSALPPEPDEGAIEALSVEVIAEVLEC